MQRHASHLLFALSSPPLSAQFAKKYFRNLSLAPLMQYVASQLMDNQTLDLLVLKEVVMRMSGIEGVQDQSAAQLEAAAGGPELIKSCAAVSSPHGAQAASDNTRKKVAARLKESLLAAGATGGNGATGGRGSSSSGLLFPMLALIAQARNMILFNYETRHLKLVGMLYDQCQETLRQYLEFLELAAPGQQFAALLPPLPQLVLRYKLDPLATFDIFRPVRVRLCSGSLCDIGTTRRRSPCVRVPRALCLPDELSVHA